MAFPKNGQNWTFCLKSIVFNHFSKYFEQFKYLFVSHVAFTIAFRQILIFQKSCNIALTILVQTWIVAHSRYECSGVTGGGGGRLLTGKLLLTYGEKEVKKKGKGVQIEKKRRKIVKGKVKK